MNLFHIEHSTRGTQEDSSPLIIQVRISIMKLYRTEQLSLIQAKPIKLLKELLYLLKMYSHLMLDKEHKFHSRIRK